MIRAIYSKAVGGERDYYCRYQGLKQIKEKEESPLTLPPISFLVSHTVVRSPDADVSQSLPSLIAMCKRVKHGCDGSGASACPL